MKYIIYILILCSLALVGCSLVHPQLQFKNIYIGYNGLKYSKNKVTIFDDKSSIENSWIGSSLSKEELIQLFNKIDFSRQFLLVYLQGEDGDTTGTIFVENLSYTSDSSLRYINVITSVNVGYPSPKKCTLPKLISYPFVLAVVERPKNDFKVAGSSYVAYSFEDECVRKRTNTFK
jgi:hypothetical protein